MATQAQCNGNTYIDRFLFFAQILQIGDHGGHTGDKTLLAGNAADRCDRLHSIVGGGGGIEEDR